MYLLTYCARSLSVCEHSRRTVHVYGGFTSLIFLQVPDRLCAPSGGCSRSYIHPKTHHNFEVLETTGSSVEYNLKSFQTTLLQLYCCENIIKQTKRGQNKCWFWAFKGHTLRRHTALFTGASSPWVDVRFLLRSDTDLYFQIIFVQIYK